MKKQSDYKRFKGLFKDELIKHFRGEVPLAAKINLFLFRTFLRRRYVFFMQQVIMGYAFTLAYKRSLEWKMDQIINWQKQRK